MGWYGSPPSSQILTAAQYAWASAPAVSPRAELGRQLAASIPPYASVSASTALYPHLSQRAGAYLFPTLHDAEYVLVDVTTPYPAGAGGAYERLHGLLTNGEYRLLAAEDGFIMLTMLQGHVYWADLCAHIDRPDLVFDPRFDGLITFFHLIQLGRKHAG